MGQPGRLHKLPDPIRLVRMVNEIGRLVTVGGPVWDPIQLVWMVNEILWLTT